MPVPEKRQEFPPEKLEFTVPEAAEYLGMHIQNLKKAIYGTSKVTGEPLIKSEKRGRNRVFQRADLDEYLRLSTGGKRADPDSKYHGWRQKYSKKYRTDNE